MSKKDFFILIIKLFGLYSIVTALFLTLPQNFSIVLFDFRFSSIIYMTVVFAVILALFIFLIFKAHHIVSFLKLEKGFDNDRLELGQLTSIEIVKITILIIGGFLIIDNIPLFLNQTFMAFYSDIHSEMVNSTHKLNWFLSGLNIVMGYLMISNLNFIVRLLRLKNKSKK